MAKQKKSKKAKEITTENLYTVEKILSKRIVNGKVLYYLKWLGYPESENTWEPEENLECPSLIYDFEKQRVLKSGANSEGKECQKESKDCERLATASRTLHCTGRKKKPVDRELKVVSTSSRTSGNSLASSLTSATKVTDSAESLQSGFVQGWEAEMILGATQYCGHRLFLIKWFVCLHSDN